MAARDRLDADQLIDLVLDAGSWRSWDTAPERGEIAEDYAGVQRATALGLPLVAAPVSGGTRMQEGTPAFVWMAQISVAVAAHKAAGLPYLV